MNWMRDIYEEDEPRQTIWQKIGMFLGCAAFIVILWGVMFVASAYEDHVRCLNGYTEVCIPEDFN